MTQPVQPTAPTLAAPAPQQDDDQPDDVLAAADAESDQQYHDLCDAWSHWCATRRFFGPPPVSANILGKLSSKSPAFRRAGGPDAECSAQLSALHIAISAQPRNALDRMVFELHYLYRVRNVKAAAAELGIGRAHWYRLLRSFRRRVCIASRDIMAINTQGLQQQER